MTTQNPQAAVVMQEDAYCDNANMFFVQIPEVTDDKLYAMAAVTTSISSASRLYPLLNNLWNEVDRLCCELYRLSDSDKEIIMSNPRTDHYYE